MLSMIVKHIFAQNVLTGISSVMEIVLMLILAVHSVKIII